MKLGKQKRVSRQVLAWLMVIAMTLTMANLPVQFTKAAEINLNMPKTGNLTVAKNPDGSDYIADIIFSIPSQIQTKQAIESNKVTSVEVTLTVESFEQGSGANAACAMIYAMPDNWVEWNTSKEVPLVAGQQIKLSFDFASMVWGNATTLGKIGVRFANAKDGSTVKYKDASAKLITSGSASTATSAPSGGSSTGNVSDVSIVRKNGDGHNPPDYSEYCFAITNNSSSDITGIQILIPTSTAVTMGYVNGYSAKYDAEQGGVVVYYSTTLKAGQTVDDSDMKVGFSTNGATVGESRVLAVNVGNSGGGTNSGGLDYELNGTKDLAYADTPVGKHGKLSVKAVSGYDAPVLVDESGVPIQLRGASTHGMQWYPDYVNESAFHTLRDEWGMNLVRLVCYPRDYNGYTVGGKDQLDGLIQKGVDYATNLGMYAIVDWHVHNYNPNEVLTEAKEFFTKYAAMYKDKKNVLYEICNEPSEGTPWYDGTGNDLYTYCKTIIPIIRAVDEDAVIICGTRTWSQCVDEVAAHPMKELGYENIMYTFHFYSATHYEGLMDKVRTATKAGTPIFVTEFGVCSADGNGNYDTANADRWIELLDEFNISFACWSLCNKDEAASYFVPSCSKTQGGWTADDLTTTGKWLFNTCRAHEDKELGTDTKKPGAGNNTGGSTGDNQGGSSGDNQGGTSGDNQGGGSGDNQGGTSGDNQGGGSGDNQGGTSGGNQGGTSGGNQGGTSGGSQGGTSGDNQGGTSGDNQGGTSGGNQGGTSGGNQGGTSGDNQGGTPGGDKGTTSSGGSGLYSDNPKEGVNATGMKLTVDVKNVAKLAVKSTHQLAPKKSMQLRVALLPANAASQKLTYNSSNPKVAKVSATGKVTAGKKAGKTVITITSESGIQKKLTVKVMKKAVKKITVKASKKKIKVKKKVKLKAKTKPGKKKASASLYWKSSNTKVATVTQKGVVKAKKKGKVKITAYATDGSGKKKAVKLNVKK